MAQYVEFRDGGYYIQGTRISLDSIVAALKRGESPATIRVNFELLRLEEVVGAIAYYRENQSEIDAYLAHQDAKWAKGRKEAEPLPEDLRERLQRAREELHPSRHP